MKVIGQVWHIEYFRRDGKSDKVHHIVFNSVEAAKQYAEDVLVDDNGAKWTIRGNVVCGFGTCKISSEKIGVYIPSSRLYAKDNYP